MRLHKFSRVLVILCVFFWLVSLPLAFGVTEQESAFTKISEAEDAVLSAYGAALEAERAGGNVSSLLVRLNEAGTLLSKAKHAYNIRDFNSAESLAKEGVSKLDGFVAEADRLRWSAANAGYWDFMVNFVGSGVGALGALVGGLVVWNVFKTRRKAGRKVGFDLVEYGLLYWTIIGVLVLLAASPFLSRVLVYPRTEFFTELWILDANRMAEDYPYNVTRNQEYSIYLGIGNRLGYCAYYQVQVKFRNQTQKAPTSFGPIEERSPSPLPSLFNISAFVADEEILEIPLKFSFDYVVNESASRVDFLGLRLNDVWLDMNGYTVSWDSERQSFRGFLFFELWLYNAEVDTFKYHGRFVGLWLNMTV